MSSRPQTAYEILDQQPDGLRAVIDDLPVGLIVTDKTGTAVMFNCEAKRIFGHPSPGVSAVEWCWSREVYRPDKETRYSRADLSLARALCGEEVIRELIFVRRSRVPGGLWLRTSSRPLIDGVGRICGAVAVFFDVTEFRSAAEHMKLLSLAVEQTADSIVITDKSGTIEYVNSAFQATTGYSRQEAVGKTPALLKSGRHNDEFYTRMWSTILGGDTFRDTLVNRKKSGELYYAEQTITPIRNDEGVITHFVSVLKDVTAIRKQQEQAIQLGLAREVQEKLHACAASIPGVEIGAITLPSQETGGDYFDSIPSGDYSLTIAVGDVSGHGIFAALGMALTRAYVRSASSYGLDEVATLATINNMLCTDLNDGHYVTLILAHVDLHTRTLSYASAGHIPALLFHSSGAVEMLDSTGIPLGLFKDCTFMCRTMPIISGQMLVMLTDGITDSSAELGTDWVVDYVCAHRSSSAKQIADGLCKAALAFAGDDPCRDDMTALIIKMPEELT